MRHEARLPLSFRCAARLRRESSQKEDMCPALSAVVSPSARRVLRVFTIEKHTLHFPTPAESSLSREHMAQVIELSPQDDSSAQHRLFALLYEELRRIAQRELRGSGRSLTFSPTTLLHEVYLNLSERERVLFPDRAHFLAYASRAMRGVIIDAVRRGQALKRGAGFEITALTADVTEPEESTQLQRLSAALEHLEMTEPRLAVVVNLKYFCGFSLTDIAAMWSVSERTLQRDWRKARLFLGKFLTDQDRDDEDDIRGRVARDQSVSR